MDRTSRGVRTIAIVTKTSSENIRLTRRKRVYSLQAYTSHETISRVNVLARK
jgi:hypothetical protein